MAHASEAVGEGGNRWRYLPRQPFRLAEAEYPKRWHGRSWAGSPSGHFVTQSSVRNLYAGRHWPIGGEGQPVKPLPDIGLRYLTVIAP